MTSPLDYATSINNLERQLVRAEEAIKDNENIAGMTGKQLAIQTCESIIADCNLALEACDEAWFADRRERAQRKLNELTT